MNAATDRMNGILMRTTDVFKPGELEVVPDNYRILDFDLESLFGVDTSEADGVRDEFLEILASYPKHEKLEKGQSYTEFSRDFPLDCEMCLRAFALGEVLGVWRVVTPSRTGCIDRSAAHARAMNGFINVEGYRII